MDDFDFALDTSKLDNIITDIGTEKTNMENSINNIYEIVKDMGNHWEGETYKKAKETIEKYHNDLNSSVVLVSKIIELLNNNHKDSVTAIEKINNEVE